MPDVSRRGPAPSSTPALREEPVMARSELPAYQRAVERAPLSESFEDAFSSYKSSVQDLSGAAVRNRRLTTDQIDQTVTAYRALPVESSARRTALAALTEGLPRQLRGYTVFAEQLRGPESAALTAEELRELFDRTSPPVDLVLEHVLRLQEDGRLTGRQQRLILSELHSYAQRTFDRVGQQTAAERLARQPADQAAIELHGAIEELRRSDRGAADVDRFKEALERILKGRSTEECALIRRAFQERYAIASRSVLSEIKAAIQLPRGEPDGRTLHYFDCLLRGFEVEEWMNLQHDLIFNGTGFFGTMSSERQNQLLDLYEGLTIDQQAQLRGAYRQRYGSERDPRAQLEGSSRFNEVFGGQPPRPPDPIRRLDINAGEPDSAAEAVRERRTIAAYTELREQLGFSVAEGELLTALLGGRLMNDDGTVIRDPQRITTLLCSRLEALSMEQRLGVLEALGGWQGLNTKLAALIPEGEPAYSELRLNCAHCLAEVLEPRTHRPDGRAAEAPGVLLSALVEQAHADFTPDKLHQLMVQRGLLPAQRELAAALSLAAGADIDLIDCYRTMVGTEAAADYAAAVSSAEGVSQALRQLERIHGSEVREALQKVHQTVTAERDRQFAEATRERQTELDGLQGQTSSDAVARQTQLQQEIAAERARIHGAAYIRTIAGANLEELPEDMLSQLGSKEQRARFHELYMAVYHPPE